MLLMKYFVLKPVTRHKDIISTSHALASREAMLTYATFIEAHDSYLAKELRDWVGVSERETE